MSSISVEQPPVALDPDLSAYLERLQVRINIALSQSSQFDKLTALPKNPQDGKIYYFSQTIGATITSVGFWGYEAGAWAKL